MTLGETERFRLSTIVAGNSSRQGRFTDEDHFSQFVSEVLDKRFKDIVNNNNRYLDQVKEFIDCMDAEGSISNFVDHLYMALGDRADLRGELRPLIYKIEQVSKWFCHYSEVDESCKIFVEKVVFPCLGKYGKFLEEDLKEIARVKKLDKATQAAIESSKYFVALIGIYYTRSGDQLEILRRALEAWQNLSADPRHKFLVFLLGHDAQEWWENQALEREGMRIERLEEEPGDEAIERAKQILLDFPINAPLDFPAERKPHPIIVLGEERAANTGGSHGSRAVDELLDYLRKRDPKRVEHWDDGWYRKSLSKDECARLFDHDPVFVRAILDNNVNKEFVRERLKGALLSATGFGHLDDGAWNEHLAKSKRVYWSTGRQDWDDKNDLNESWWVGQVEDIGQQLAELAGFAKLRPHSAGHVRYERPDLRDKAKRERAEQLLGYKLPEAIRPDRADGNFDTVPIIEEGIEESVRKFSPSTLNVLAVHDLETRPGDEDDAIERFSRAEDKIQTAVKAREDGQKLEIVRIAVLFNNFSTFDGVRFDQGSPVSNWNILKCPSSDSGMDMDPNDLMALKREAELHWPLEFAERVS